VTRPGYPPEHKTTLGLRPGDTITDHGVHTVATIERCHDGLHLIGTDGWETIAGARHMWTVTR
jgi:hypothetical protein